MTTSSSSSPITLTLTALGAATEADTSLTGLDGDYKGSFATATSVTIALSGTSFVSGSADVTFTAIDDEIDEPTETVLAAITGATANNGAPVNFNPAPVENTVASGDYTARVTTQTSPESVDDVGVTQVSTGADSSVTVKLTQELLFGERPVTMHPVELSVDPQAPGGDEVVIVNDQGNPVPVLTKQTDPDGRAIFVIRGTQDGLLSAKLVVKYTNAEGDLKSKDLLVIVSDAP